MITCASCGTANPAEARFCMACGGALARSAAPQGERKVITALFCDLVGSTELADRLDPEDVDAILRSYYGVARRRIHAYGGRVEKFIGDAVVGVFGVPSAHEDDPERAVRAALRLIEELGTSELDIHVRIGICTGEALVRNDLDADAGEGFVTGDALNIAARLQSAAPTDGIAVADPTYRACAGIFRWEDLGELSLKGRAEPMRTWQPLAPVARIDTEASAESTPFVGRDLELQTLVRLFERSRTTPSIEVATVVADPGIGKSRLVRELHRYIADLPDLVTWRTGRCLPYGDGISFWALAEIVAVHAGILETDDQETVSAKLDAALSEHEPSLRAWMKDRLGPIVGLEVGASPPQEDETFAAWRRFIEGIAKTGPLVLIVEDLHWADDALVRFLTHLAGNSAGLPILLVVTARPEIEERHPAWLARARRSTVLSLAALPDSAVADLVRAALPEATPEILGSILERAAGSPLYTEQLAAMLREAGDDARDDVDGSMIPTTIQALLASRIDALGPDVKPVLLDASVIGRTFWSGAVATLGQREPAAVAPALTDLARRELTRPAYPSSMEGEAEYAFWHALVRDVAYGALPRGARAAKHRAAAEWIAERSGGSRGLAAEIIAEHYARAFALATALGSTADAAAVRGPYAEALLGAATHAMATSPATAAEHARRALEVVAPDDPRRVELLTTLGRALLSTGLLADARTPFEEARALLHADGGPVAAASVAVPLATLLGEAGDAARAEEVLEEARTALADRPGPELLDVMAAQAMGLIRVGSKREGQDAARRVIQLADELGLTPPARALTAFGGDENFARAIEIDIRAGDLRAASRARYNRAVHFRGRGDRLLELIEEAIAFDSAHGIGALGIYNVRAWSSFFIVGRPSGVDELESLIAKALGTGDAFTAADASSTLVEIRAARGQPAVPPDALRERFTAAGFEDGLEWLLAKMAYAAGDLDTTRATLAASLDEGLVPDDPWTLIDMCLSVGERSLSVRAIEAVRMAAASGHGTDPEAQALDAATDDAMAGRLAEADGDLEAAVLRYDRAWRTFAELIWETPAAIVRGWLGRCLVALGRLDEARPHLEGAREHAVRLGLARSIAELDALLERAQAGPIRL